MSKYRYTELEQQLNNVLVHQDKELARIAFPDTKDIDENIRQSEELLRSLGVKFPNGASLAVQEIPKKVMVVPSWESLCLEAEAAVGNQCVLEDLFTAEELQTNEQAIVALN